MTVHLVTFSTPDYSRARARCVSSALENSVTHTHPIEPQMLPPDMQAYCEGKRGFGYWQWKPMAIQIAVRGCANGDILIYSDAGVEFINNVSHIIELMDQDIFLFGNNWEHAHWCKRDVIENVYSDAWLHRQLADILTPKANSDLVWKRFGKQAQASVIFFRISDYTRAFVKEWLDWCLFEGGRLIDDSPSRLPNHPEFREHRHDQAILTTMAYREGVKLHYWPAQYNDGAFSYEKLPEYAGDDYPILFLHHRRRDHEWEQVA